MKKKTSKKASKAKPKPNTLKKRASQRVLSAAAQIRRTTKKIIDDVFLKVVGARVLERAEEVTQNLKKEKKVKGRK